MSLDAFIDPFDPKISSNKISRQLNQNESYTIQLNLTLPLDLESTNYYFIVSVDNSKLIDQYNRIYNEESALIYIKQTLSTDLSITQVDLNKQNFDYEESLNATWMIINNGTQMVSRFLFQIQQKIIETRIK